uniref:Uncharacterized protein n=1 Tax=Macrostomum lignano TaxID=282301 RepID=A0A1I8GD66_9PLAT
MMDKCLSPRMLCLVNWSGKGCIPRCQEEFPECSIIDYEQLGFKRVRKLFIDAVQDLFPRDPKTGEPVHSDKSIENAIKDVLKHALEREVARQKRLQAKAARATDNAEAAAATATRGLKRAATADDLSAKKQCKRGSRP